MSDRIRIKNKRASFEYEFIETFTCGMVLKGTEIKSIRNGEVNINDAFCFLKKGELWLKSCFIAPYEQGNINNHDPYRERKLLLNATELRKIAKKIKDTGVTIVPTALFVNDSGLAKLDIALARGKKLYDKRQSIKDREVKRDLDRKYKL